jgi:hypothetical protein
MDEFKANHEIPSSLDASQLEKMIFVSGLVPGSHDLA